MKPVVQQLEGWSSFAAEWQRAAAEPLAASAAAAV